MGSRPSALDDTAPVELERPSAASARPSPVSPAVTDEAEKLPPVTIVAVSLSGNETTTDISPSDSVWTLKEELASRLQVATPQVRLTLQDGGELFDHEVLRDRGVDCDTQVSVIVMPPVPEWAAPLGFTYDHPSLLRDYRAQHNLGAVPEPDESVWAALKGVVDKKERSLRALDAWEHKVEILSDDVYTAIVRARPGEMKNLRITGKIWNHNGDTCIHQLMLILDTEIIGELSDGVPMRGRPIDKRLKVKAPTKTGIYMFWTKNDLQYSMRDARRNCEQHMGGRILPQTYPDHFLGWLVVA